MGCDIHCIVEKKDKDGMWKTVKGRGIYIKYLSDSLKEAIEKGDIKNIEYYTKRVKEERKEQGLDTCWIFDDRNYELFALLADVRNNDDWPALFPARGLPPLPSISTRFELRDWGEDAHSWTYCTLKDIKDADWNREVEKTAVVEDSEWDEFLKHPEWKRPRSYCAWSSSDTANLRAWKYTYKDIADRFFKNVVSKMEIMARHNPSGDEGVRLVIFFDN